MTRAISLMLIAVGALLALLGVTAFVSPGPPDVSAEVLRSTRKMFAVTGLIVIGLVALGVFVRPAGGPQFERRLQEDPSDFRYRSFRPRGLVAILALFGLTLLGYRAGLDGDSVGAIIKLLAYAV